jgi:hypothetical protein
MKVGDLVTISHMAWQDLAGVVGVVLSVDPLYTLVHFSSMDRALCVGVGLYNSMEVVYEGR